MLLSFNSSRLVLHGVGGTLIIINPDVGFWKEGCIIKTKTNFWIPSIGSRLLLYIREGSLFTGYVGGMFLLDLNK